MSLLTRSIKDPFPAISHAVGALLSIGALIVLLLLAAGRPMQTAAVAIYGASLIILYTASALTHAIRCSPRASLRLDQFDYAAIYVLIAGTYTPICLGPLWGPWGRTLLAGEWALAGCGILSVLFMHGRATWVRFVVYVAMGWLGFVRVDLIWNALPAPALAWLLAGGVMYSVGAVVFTLNRPRLWPGRFGAHDLWHMMVLAGSACHFAVVAGYVAR
jgi:hemolysin III